MCAPDLVQQHVQNERIRDTCASQRKDLALQQAALKHQRESLPTRTTATSPRASIQQYKDHPQRALDLPQ
jgi:hypothetical protein